MGSFRMARFTFSRSQAVSYFRNRSHGIINVISRNFWPLSRTVVMGFPSSYRPLGRAIPWDATVSQPLVGPPLRQMYTYSMYKYLVLLANKAILVHRTSRTSFHRSD